LRRLSNVSREAIVVVRDDVILEVNAACGRLFGRSAEDLIGARVLPLIAVSDQALIADQLRNPDQDLDQREINVCAADGRLAPAEFS
jgi:PAS domain S-box-containing protein